MKASRSMSVTVLACLLAACVSTEPRFLRERKRARAAAHSAVSPAATARTPAAQPSARQIAPHPERAAALAPAGLSVRQQLARTRVGPLSVRNEESLRAVVRAIQQGTGLALVVDRRAENAAFDAGVVFDYNLEYPLAVDHVLDLISELAGDDVTWVVRHDAVLFTTVERARSQPLLVSHDIRELTQARTDFIAPRLDRIRLIDELEDDDGGGPFGGVGERVVQLAEEDVLTLVQENVAVGTWEADGVLIEVQNGFLFVVHELEVQRQVRRFLNLLR